jgi:hypothetical protein
MRHLAAPIMLLALGVSPLGAQSTTETRVRSNTSRFFAALGLTGAAIEIEDLSEETESGGGMALRLGYGFTPRFAMFVEGNAAALEAERGDIGLGHFDIGARYHFANAARPWVPFLEAALTGRALLQEDWVLTDDEGEIVEGELELSGAGFSFGGGVLYFFDPRVALNADLKWTVGEFDEVRIGNVSVSGFELDGTSTRLNVGVHWFPQRPRR